jgi:7-keto-8-aminopelargonate synthetase-like enzyme
VSAAPPGEDPRYAPLHARLQAIDAAGRRRQLRALRPDGPTTARLDDGREITIWCSNDYLGLARHPRVLEAWGAGAGAGSARLISGDRPAHRALEAALSARFGRPATLLGSGWHANLAAMGALFTADDLVASDALVHASLIDGLRLSRARRAVLPHGAVEPPPGARALVTEGLFSMDGDRPDLRAARAACDAARAWLVVDEAHAVGVIGPGGQGACAAAGVDPDVLIGTLGKAYGAAGGFVVGPPVLRELLISAGRAFLFSTGLPEPVCGAARVGLELADAEGLRERLRDRGRRLRDRLRQVGLEAPGDDPILPLRLGPRTMEVAEGLLQRGIYVAGIRPPTVPAGEERLRITVSAAHTDDQIDALVEALAALVRPA